MKARVSVLVLSAGLVALGCTAASGHYPVVVANAPWLPKGGTVRLDLTNGHPFMNDRYDSPAPEQVRVRLPLSTMVDLGKRLTTVQEPQSAAGAGTNAPVHRVEMPLNKEGDYVFSWRTRTTEKPQRNVTDYVKVVIHCGDAQIGWWATLGDPLEILPLTRPYGIHVGDTFRGQVLEEGKPMIGGVIEAETWIDVMPSPPPELAHSRRAERTDPQGCFSVTLDRAGWWLLSCATDGGPGEQGGDDRPQKRAVMWVFVGLDPSVQPGSNVRPMPDEDDLNQPLPQVGG